ncbi:MAG TPA: hypothetical protein VMU85_15550 [Stellaceae bacterium]|nr:hypothetical protein [Stellaceae bacterium]
MVARITLEAPAIQEFMAFPLGVERNGMDLTMGTALVGLNEDPWDLAQELSAMPRRDAMARLAGLLERLGESAVNVAEVARRAVTGLPIPRIEGASFRVALRLALRSPEILLALALCAVPSLIAMLSLLAVMQQSAIAAAAAGLVLVIAFVVASRYASVGIGLLIISTAGLMGLPFLLVQLVA